MIDRIGKQLGSYRLLKLLGKGGFAEVYLGEHVHLKTSVAIKLLHASLSYEEAEAFQNEAHIVARLEHPHIVRVLDFAVQDETPYLVMEYAPGGSLRTRHPKGALLSLDTIVTYARQIAEALQHAHAQRLIHRDVKPENMLLNARDEVLLSDFGIATLSHNSRSQTTEEVVGTAAYMAPEQFLGKPRPASDQYALGIVVYEWLAGSRPFNGSFLEISGQHLHLSPPSLQAQRPDLSADVEAIVLRALAKDPHDRFSTIQAFAEALEQAGSQQEAPPVSVGAKSAALLAIGEQTTVQLSDPSALAETQATAPTVSPTWKSGPPSIRSAPKRPRPQSNRRPLILAVSALVLLLVPLGVVFGYWLPTQRAQQSLAATHTAASQNATSTGVAQASAQSVASATAQQATAIVQNATATAQYIPPTLPYRVQVPGPCPGSNAAWSNGSPGGDELDCQADRLTLKGNQQGLGAFQFTLKQFPQNFLVSLDVSHLMSGSSLTSIILQVNQNTQNGYYLSLALQSDNLVIPLIASGNSGGVNRSPANLSRINTIAIKVRGAAASFLLNGVVVDAGNQPQLLAVTSISIILTGSAGDQVDLQNFTITPT